MRNALKLATLTGALGLGLALAEDAVATQRVIVSQTVTSLTIKILQDSSDAQPARIVIHVPAGLATNAAPGDRIGFASGHVIARDAADARVAIRGDLRVDDVARHLTDACPDDVDADDRVWMVDFALAATRLQVPIYVTYSHTAVDQDFGTAKLELCFGAVDVPAGTPGRSPVGAQLLDLTLALTNTNTPLVGTPRWTSFFTPYGAGTGRPDPERTVEVRSLVAPGSVTLTAKSSRRGTIWLGGTVQQAETPVAGARVLIRGRGKALAVTRTSASGTYRAQVRVTNAKSLRAVVHADARDITSSGCSLPSLPNVACVTATMSGFDASSRAVKIRGYAFRTIAAVGETPRVLDRTLVCAMGQGSVNVGASPDAGVTPGVVTVTGNSTGGTFPFVSIDTDRGAYIDARHCRSTSIRVPLTPKGLPGPPAVTNTDAACPTPGRVLVRIRYEYLPGPHAKGYVGGRLRSASLAVRLYKTKRPLAFAKLTLNGTRSQFFSAASCF
jgi:predicted aconitase with swiveling domain